MTAVLLVGLTVAAALLAALLLTGQRPAFAAAAGVVLGAVAAAVWFLVLGPVP